MRTPLQTFAGITVCFPVRQGSLMEIRIRQDAAFICIQTGRIPMRRPKKNKIRGAACVSRYPGGIGRSSTPPKSGTDRRRGASRSAYKTLTPSLLPVYAGRFLLEMNKDRPRESVRRATAWPAKTRVPMGSNGVDFCGYALVSARSRPPGPGLSDLGFRESRS